MLVTSGVVILPHGKTVQKLCVHEFILQKFIEHVSYFRSCSQAGDAALKTQMEIPAHLESTLKDRLQDGGKHCRENQDGKEDSTVACSSLDSSWIWQRKTLAMKGHSHAKSSHCQRDFPCCRL